MNDGVIWGEVAAVVIDRYHTWPRLEELRREIESTTELLVLHGFTSSEVDLVIDGDVRSVIDAVRGWHPNTPRLLLYWGGHGKALDDNEFYLCCGDTPKNRDPDEHTAVAARTLGGLLADLRVPEIVLLVDACGAGGGAEPIVSAFRARARRSGFRTSLAVISSAQRFERATEGVFARALTEVLRDGPPTDDSYVPWTDHDQYIRVPELAKAVEVRMARTPSPRSQSPDHDMVGMVGPFFPNPRFRRHLPDAVVAEEPGTRRRALLPQDVTDHFMVKFRGIDTSADHGWYFTGRRGVLRRLTAWLSGGRGMVVVTGPPGAGKSALLGRLAVLSDADYRRHVDEDGGLDGEPSDTLPLVGAIDAGMHAKNKSLIMCVRELAEALQVASPVGGWRSPADLIGKLADLPGTVTVLLDALDEAQPSEVARIAGELLRPMAELSNARVLVGTRPGVRFDGGIDDSDEILDDLLGATTEVIRLDQDDARRSIAEYARRRLVETPGSVYVDEPVLAERLADRIAESSGGIFLFARLLTRTFALHGSPVDLESPDLAELLRGGIGEAFAEDLRRFGFDEPRLRDLLRALAWAEGSGLPRHDVWLAVANALADERVYDEADLAWALKHAGSHIVASGQDNQTVYRLYHQSFNDFFRLGADIATVQSKVTDALLALAEVEGQRHWRTANPYLLCHLAGHAAAAGRLAELCEDADFLVYADPARLQQVLGSVSYHERPLVRLYWRALADLHGTTSTERSAILNGVALRDEPSAIRLLPWDPHLLWHPLWSRARQTAFHRPLPGHVLPVKGLAFGTANGRLLIGSGGGDTTTRLWDPVTGERAGMFHDHHASVMAVVVTTVNGRGIVASGDSDGVVHVWDTATGGLLSTVTVPGGPVRCLVEWIYDGTSHLVAGDEAGKIRVWHLPDLTEVVTLPDHHTTVWACAVLTSQRGESALFTSGADGRVLRWLPGRWRPTGQLDTAGHTISLAAARLDGREVVITGGRWGRLAIWNFADKSLVRSQAGHDGPIGAMAYGHLDDRPMIATAGDDGGVRLWDARTGRPLRTLRTARAIQPTVLEKIAKRTVALGSGRVLSVDEATREKITEYSGRDSIISLALAEVDGDPQLVSGGIDGTVRLWDLSALDPVDHLTGGAHVAITSSCVVRLGDAIVVATGHRSGAVTLRDGRSGTRLLRLAAHRGVVHAVTLGQLDGRLCVASAGEDGSLLVHDANSGELLPEPCHRHRDPNNPKGFLPLWAAAFVGTGSDSVLAYPRYDLKHVELVQTGRRRWFPMPPEEWGGLTSIVTCATSIDHLMAVATSTGGIEVRVVDPGGDFATNDRLNVPIYASHDEGPFFVPAIGEADGVALLATARRLWRENKGKVTVRNVRTGDLLAERQYTRGHVTALTLGRMARGPVLAVALDDGSLDLVDPFTGQSVCDLPTHRTPIRSLSFLGINSEAILVSCSADGVQAISLRSEEYEEDVATPDETDPGDEEGAVAPGKRKRKAWWARW